MGHHCNNSKIQHTFYSSGGNLLDMFKLEVTKLEPEGLQADQYRVPFVKLNGHKLASYICVAIALRKRKKLRFIFQ